jgi:hypothetical protein
LIGGWLKNLPPVVAIPVCVALFSVLAAAVGLLTRADIAALAGVVARRRPPHRDVPPALDKLTPGEV